MCTDSSRGKKGMERRREEGRKISGSKTITKKRETSHTVVLLSVNHITPFSLDLPLEASGCFSSSPFQKILESEKQAGP